MYRSAQIVAPQGFANLLPGIVYFFLSNRPERVLLVEFVEKIGSKKKKCGKDGKYQAVARTWDARIIVLTRPVFESGIESQKIVEAPDQLTGPPWLKGVCTNFTTNAEVQHLDKLQQHDEFVERRFSLIESAIEKESEILASKNPDRTINEYARQCSPPQKPTRIRAWVYAYLLFRTTEVLHYASGNLGKWDRSNPGQKRGRPGLSGQAGYNAYSEEKKWVVDSWYRHCGLGRSIKEVYVLALQDRGCLVRRQADGQRVVYHPEGLPFLAYGAYRSNLVNQIGVDFHAKLTHHFHRILTHPDS